MKAPSKPVRTTRKVKPKAKSASRKSTAPRASTVKPASKPASKTGAKRARKPGPVLLSGGNLQIAKADGDAPVQAYFAALSGWQREAGQRLDALITRHVPGVRKAVKWNSPFYGVEGQGWFLGVHTFTRYLKVAFFRGTALQPLPPGTSKDKDARYVDLHEGDDFDSAQMASWVKQAASLPGWDPGSRVAKKRERAEPAEPTAPARARSHEQASGKAASRLIDQRIRELGDWRGETLARMRKLILEADPEVTEECKWMGTPVWSHDGIVCTGESYSKVVKLTFAHGARLPDPARLFNSSLEGNTRRAIDLHEGERIDARAFQSLVKAAVAENGLRSKKR